MSEDPFDSWWWSALGMAAFAALWTFVGFTAGYLLCEWMHA